MHELSVAVNLIALVEENARKAGAERVFEVEVEVGKLSGIVLEALEFAMDEAIQGTLLQEATIRYVEVDALAQCEDCGEQFLQQEMYTPCPKCASFRSNLLQGNDLVLKKIIV